MRIFSWTMPAVAGAALVALMATMTIGGTAGAADRQDGRGMHTQKNVAVDTGNRTVNRRGNAQRQEFSENRGHNNYGHRRGGHRGVGFGVAIDLGGDSSCRYSYRKWQATGSRYWRSRYYDCVG